MKTVNDFIKELQAMRPDLRELPVVIRAENGLLLEPWAKIQLEKYGTMLDEPSKIIIVY